MGRGGSGVSFGEATASAPRVPPVAVSGGGVVEREDQWRSFDNSVSAVSFGFVATAILISMFLVMAIFERFLRPRSSDAASVGAGDAPDGGGANMRKLDYPSPKMTVYPKGVSVLMPGERMPTFIAHPVPAPCPPERVSPTYTSS
ncbi:CTTNBP 2 amino-terminal-like protein [Perilla frutescens var. hirtella]|uniref:CTTNBP 2 amino-terminal-like protein n=1 Tax=Perilla frutescens var. hirtella TaxID=608512 RepID=A0AAD4J0X6_PERFH|nr:CTTNBP 2 amino-terminal-like protein [Perilla frutescens var. frutescens]KAH6775330.1 CTTNBP 2 amino-terminal-like protein [Perilla frutescens var. hirtella]KAH6825148.1 CTTNBP 2 amino-terminal-like protein [Perilla frutescens var. hirtella]